MEHDGAVDVPRQKEEQAGDEPNHAEECNHPYRVERWTVREVIGTEEDTCNHGGQSNRDQPPKIAKRCPKYGTDDHPANDDFRSRNHKHLRKCIREHDRI